MQLLRNKVNLKKIYPIFRKQLTEKENEYLEFDIQQRLEKFKDQIDFIKRRLDNLEDITEQQKIRMIVTEKQQDKRSPIRLFSLLSVITAITAMFYKFRRGII